MDAVVDPKGRFRALVVGIMGLGCTVSLLSGTFLVVHGAI